MSAVPCAGDIDHTPSHAAGARLVYLDGWRGYCILAVIVAHFVPVPFIAFGNLGVDLFFVLSGRLMADILFVERFPLRQFYVRRFSRIWPGLFVYTTVCLAVFFGAVGFLHVGALAALAAVTFTTNYKIMLFGQTELLDHTWSLCVEEHSYIVLGIIAYLCRSRSIGTVKIVIMCCAVAMSLNGIVRSLAWPGNAFLYWQSDVRAASVFYAAAIYLHLRTTSASGRSNLALLALPAGILLFNSHAPLPVSFTLGTICLAIAVCSLDRLESKYRAVFGYGTIVLLGTYSFSIYVWQQLIYKIFQHLRALEIIGKTEGAITRPLFVVAVCLLGAVSYHLIEKPARRYINETWASGWRGRAKARLGEPAR